MSATSGNSKKKVTNKTNTFEGAMSRLENIVVEMEEGNLNLEEMIKRFEEGQALITFCTKKLNEVEKRVEKLVKKGDKVEAVPLDEDSEDAVEEDEEELF
jgi:exodeoxyribonuclease VII small subunit